jgi:hypothetical protein
MHSGQRDRDAMEANTARAGLRLPTRNTRAGSDLGRGAAVPADAVIGQTDFAANGENGQERVKSLA